MGMIKEFKAFAIKGNVVDLAVAVIIGAAFGKIITSFIEDVLTPLLLKPALDAAHLSNLSELTIWGTVKYGNFLAALINFVIVAFVLFLIIKAINASKEKEAALPTAPPETSSTDKLLIEIRDALKK